LVPSQCRVAMEEEAFKEAAEQLCRPGNDKVWINGWEKRYGDLGTQREFLERNSDLFKVVPGEGRRYTVELTLEGVEKAAAAGCGSGASQPKQSVTKTPARSWGSNAVPWNGAANGGCKGGKAAGTAHGKSGQNRDMAITTWKSGQTERASWKGGKAGGNNGWGNSKGSNNWLALPAATGWSKGSHNSKGWGKSSSSAQQQDAGSAASAAIREIEVQLRNPKDERPGHVWIEGWGQRYQWALGTLREFLDSRPDKFIVIPGQGRRYNVELVNTGSNTKGGSKGGKRPAAKSPPWRGKSAPPAKRIKTEADLQDAAKLHAKVEEVEEVPELSTDYHDLFAEALDEVAKQLEQAGGEGNVWIRDWGRRFQKKLGTLREFLEQHSDTFEVIPGQGKKFTVRIL